MARSSTPVNMLVLLGINLICLNLVQCTFYNVGVKYGVTLNVFSGRQNPRWNIDQKSPLYNELSWAVNGGPPTDLYSGMGYSGFNVEATNVFGQRAWKTIGRHTDQKLERMLLGSCPDSYRLSKQLIGHINDGIYGQVMPAPKMIQYPKQAQASVSISSEDDSVNLSIQHRILGRKKRQAGVCSVRFAPQNWNYDPVQRRNNCYNYATNIQTNTFAQPGRGSGQRYTQTTADNVYAASVRDGLTPLPGPDARNQCLIALVIWPGEDYHFLRLDNDGTWSQKSGRSRARNVDDSGNIIRDPRMADRGPYTVFAGWLGVGAGVNIR